LEKGDDQTGKKHQNDQTVESQRDENQVTRDVDPVPEDHAVFGWVIAPQYRGNSEVRERLWQPHHQYTLSAVISVPSWWRFLDLKISKCWLTDEDFRSAGGKSVWTAAGNNPEVKTNKNDSIRERGTPIDNCGNGDEASIRVKVPGDSAEISRKLSVEVADVPRLAADMKYMKIRLRVGHRAAIVITGSRLWRNTRVTLGGQEPELITVLPDMGGILAKFECVQRPPNVLPVPGSDGGDSAGSGKKNSNGKTDDVRYKAQLRVWTSEGATDPLTLWLVEDEANVGSPVKCPPLPAGKQP